MYHLFPHAKKALILVSSLCCMAILSLAEANGAAILVPNYSFEGSFAGNWVLAKSGSSSFVGAASGSSYPMADGVLLPPGQGTMVLAMYNQYAGVPQTATLVLSTTFAQDTVYTLSAAVGRAANAFDGASIALYAGETRIAFNSLTTMSKNWTLTTLTADSSGLTHDAAALLVGQTLKIVLTDLGTAAPSARTDFDNVTLQAVSVPEPALVSLIAIGFFTLCLRRRRRLA